MLPYLPLYLLPPNFLLFLQVSVTWYTPPLQLRRGVYQISMSFGKVLPWMGFEPMLSIISQSSDQRLNHSAIEPLVKWMGKQFVQYWCPTDCVTKSHMMSRSVSYKVMWFWDNLHEWALMWRDAFPIHFSRSSIAEWLRHRSDDWEMMGSMGSNPTQGRIFLKQKSC